MNRAFALHWLLDKDTMFHVTTHRYWFNSFASSGMLGLVHLQDGSVHAIARSREVRFFIIKWSAVGTSRCVLRPILHKSGQLKQSGCQVLLIERLFTLQLGLLRIASGASVGTI